MIRRRCLKSTALSKEQRFGRPPLHHPGTLVLQAWRSWRNDKAVAVLAATAFAAGIGAATAICTVVNAVMLKPLPYRDGGQFVAIVSAAVNDPEHCGSLSFQDAKAYQERPRVFDAFGWFRFAGKNLTFAGEPHHVEGVAVTPPLARQLGVDPMPGQWFRDDTGVVISAPLWRQLGADSGILGRPLTLDGRSYTVTGVMPDHFALPVAGILSAGTGTDVWIPLDPEGRGEPEGGAPHFAYARRKRDVTFPVAEADVKRVAAEIAAEDPIDHPAYCFGRSSSPKSLPLLRPVGIWSFCQPANEICGWWHASEQAKSHRALCPVTMTVHADLHQRLGDRTPVARN
jgi:putative ABC transport system permease protein